MKFIERTNYSNHFTSWVKRIVILLVITLISLAWIFGDEEYDSWWIIYPVIIVIAFGLLFSPVDDLAIDANHLYYLKSSPLSFLSKSVSFEIDQISSINSRADLRSMDDTRKYSTIIDIRFKDGSMRSFEVNMLSRDIRMFIGKVSSKITA